MSKQTSRRMLSKLAVAAAALGLTAFAAAPAFAGTINVLWYTGGTTTGVGYETAFNGLAALAPTSPGANTWNVTYWSGGAMPTGSFNVLVVASPEGSWDTNPSYTALNSAISGGSISFGDRLMLTGQDADWHYTHTPGPTNFDGPQGFLLDSINWAGNGSGMGLVALGQDGSSCSGAALGLSGYTSVCGLGENDVEIPAAYANYPINTDLTTAGLSNWSSSAHTDFYDVDPSKWIGINVDGGNNCKTAVGADCFVTIISAETGGGGITTPEPNGLLMMGLGLLATLLAAGGLRLRRNEG